MSELRLEGRLGVETITPIRDCCVVTMAKWRPAAVGEKHKCMYCDNTFKTMRAGEGPAAEFSGMMNETKQASTSPSLTVGSIWFSKNRFSDVYTVCAWCEERGISAKISKNDGMAFCVNIDTITPGTERAVWAAPGVISVIGISKMSMGDMASGGQLNPLQQGASCDIVKPAAEENVEETETTPVEKAIKDFGSALEKMFN